MRPNAPRKLNRKRGAELLTVAASWIQAFNLLWFQYAKADLCCKTSSFQSWRYVSDSQPIHSKGFVHWSFQDFKLAALRSFEDSDVEDHRNVSKFRHAKGSYDGDLATSRFQYVQFLQISRHNTLSKLRSTHSQDSVEGTFHDADCPRCKWVQYYTDSRLKMCVNVLGCWHVTNPRLQESLAQHHKYNRPRFKYLQ